MFHSRSSEKERLNSICYHINNSTFYGKKLKEDYFKLFNQNLKQALVTGGTNKHHYDIMMIHNDNSTKKCEEKSTIYYKEDLSNEVKPWVYSVQVFNGVGKHFGIGLLYAKLWYKHNIAPQEVKKNYQILSPIPSEKEWLRKDAFQCGNPKTRYGKELKQKFRDIHGETSMNGKSKKDFKENIYDYREPVIYEFTELFRSEPKIKKQLIKEIQEKLERVFLEKECFLQDTGDINSNEFSFKWYNQIKIPKIKDVVLNNRKSDITFDIITDITQNYTLVLRFGKGTGFSNIRIDIR